MFHRDLESVTARLMADAAAVSPLLPVSDAKVKRALGADTAAIVRWIVSGKRGVFLDGVKAGGKGWSTTLAACARFLIELTRKTSRDPLPRLLPSESGSVSRAGDAIRAMERRAA